MPLYRVQFITDAEWAEARIDAASFDEAFARARAIDTSTLTFQRYTVPNRVVQILVADQHGEEWGWHDDEKLMRHSAEELLIAAKNVLTALKMSFGTGWTRVARSTLGHLQDAVEDAQRRGL
jgi:hypothetical protein